MTEKIKQLILEEKHLSLGAEMVRYAGYNMPIQYTSIVEEHHCVRKGVGMFDVSHMGEFLVEGTEALDLIQKISSNDASKLKIGQAQYSCMPNLEGGIVDDLIIYKLQEEAYMLVVNASNIAKDWAWIQSQNTFENVTLTNQSEDFALLAVQGPKAQEVLQKITEVNLSEISYYHFTKGTIAGIDEVIISATGYTGSGGFELYVATSEAAVLWDAVLQAGSAEGIQPIGLGARDTLRMEMGYCLYGNDIDDTTSPLEAGLGWITKFNKSDFVNKAALEAQKTAGVSKKLVGFEMIERGIPRGGYTLLSLEGQEIGKVTSGGQSPTLNNGIGLGYIDKPFCKAGTEILVQIRKKTVKAIVKRLPLIKI